MPVLSQAGREGVSVLVDLVAVSDGHGLAYPEVISTGARREVGIAVADALVVSRYAVVNVIALLWLLLDVVVLPVVCSPGTLEGRLGVPLAAAVEALRREGMAAHVHESRQRAAGRARRLARSGAPHHVSASSD